MEKLMMCRICLATDVRMESILHTHLQDIYEKLTLKEFETKDSKPVLACYLCYARLQNCYQLSRNCLKSEALLTKMLSGKMANPTNLQEITRHMRLGTTPVIVETIENLFYDEDRQVLVDSAQPSSIEVEVKMVVKEEDIIPASRIKKEPEVDDTLQNEDLEDEVPLDIVKHEIEISGKSILKDNSAEQLENIENLSIRDVKTLEQGSPDVIENTKDLPLNGRGKFKTIVNSETTDTDMNEAYSCSYCQKTFVHKAQLTRHAKTHVSKECVKCNLCEKSFTNKTKLAKHIVQNHIHEKPFPCKKCNEGFMNKHHLNRHVVLKHVNWNRCVCEYCSEVYTTKTELKLHVHRNHNQKPLQQSSRDSSHASKTEYKCELCNKSYLRQRFYVLHYTLNHQ